MQGGIPFTKSTIGYDTLAARLYEVHAPIHTASLAGTHGDLDGGVRGRHLFGRYCMYAQ